MFESVISIGLKVAETKAYKSSDILKSRTLKRRDVVHARPQRHPPPPSYFISRS